MSAICPRTVRGRRVDKMLGFSVSETKPKDEQHHRDQHDTWRLLLLFNEMHTPKIIASDDMSQ
jgi:hypothetical protein